MSCVLVVVVHFAPKVNWYAEVCVCKGHCVKCLGKVFMVLRQQWKWLEKNCNMDKTFDLVHWFEFLKHSLVFCCRESPEWRNQMNRRWELKHTRTSNGMNEPGSFFLIQSSVCLSLQLVLYDKPYFTGRTRELYTQMRDFMTRIDRQQTAFMYNAGSIKVIGGW